MVGAGNPDLGDRFITRGKGGDWIAGDYCRKVWV